jgi:hypothetical protein
LDTRAPSSALTVFFGFSSLALTGLGLERPGATSWGFTRAWGRGGVAGSHSRPQARRVAKAAAPAACKSAMVLLPWNLPSHPLLFCCTCPPSRCGHPALSPVALQHDGQRAMMPLHPRPCTFLPLPQRSQRFNCQEPRAFAQIAHVRDHAPAAGLWPLRSPAVPHTFTYLPAQTRPRVS